MQDGLVASDDIFGMVFGVGPSRPSSTSYYPTACPLAVKYQGRMRLTSSRREYDTMLRWCGIVATDPVISKS